jgi:hypothetical protein
MLGKGKPPLNKNVDTWQMYLDLWRKWAEENPQLIDELRELVKPYDNVLSDRFANTQINQARALACILNEREK